MLTTKVVAGCRRAISTKLGDSAGLDLSTIFFGTGSATGTGLAFLEAAPVGEFDGIGLDMVGGFGVTPDFALVTADEAATASLSSD